MSPVLLISRLPEGRYACEVDRGRHPVCDPSQSAERVGTRDVRVALSDYQLRSGDAGRRRSDTSGAVLPGVTVEAASPALIEKVRTAVTDGTGQYQIVDLRPGTYAVTFTLSGFRPARRENVAVSGAGVITINGEMNVGDVTETLVIRRNPRRRDADRPRQAVLENKTINELPVARGYGAILAAIPTLQGAGANSSSSVNPSFFTAHGGPGNEGARAARRPERRRGVQRRRRVGQRLRHRQRAGNADLDLRQRSATRKSAARS